MKHIKNIDKINIKPSERNVGRSVYIGNACPVPKPTKIAADDSIGLEGKSNAGIEFTRDFPKGLTSGYGARAHHKCSTIDIVAGRVSKFSKTTDKNGKPYYCDNNFEHDAARIYISEKTDIDKNFDIRSAPDWSLESIGRSAIGLKADNIRILGNEGVRIVTGVYKDCSLGSGGAPTATPAGIELIAMNSTEGVLDLQPFVKGHDTVSLFGEILDLIRNLSGLFEQFIAVQTSINNHFSEHNHIIGLGNKSQPSPTPALGLNDPFVKGLEIQNFRKDRILVQLETMEELTSMLENEFLGVESKNFICSLYNGVN